jgi:ATP-dependent DNA helicase RecG
VTIYNPGPFPDDLTPEDYVSSDKASLKRNPLILDILFRSKDVEKEGSGFKRMNYLLEKNGLKWTFDKDSFGFCFTFYRPSKTIAKNVTNGINGTNNGTNENLSAGEHQVYDLLSSNPKLTIEKLSDLTGKSARTIQRILNALVYKGSIVRIGKTRGYWEVIK